MSGFQEQLEKVNKDRGLDPIDPDVQRENFKRRKKSFFSFASFIKGIVICSLFGAAIGAWAGFKAEQTKRELLDKLPSKTAIVQRENDDVFSSSNQQPILRMPDATIAPRTATQQAIVKEDISESADKPILPPETKIIGKSLVSAPIPGLYESAPSGLLPIIRTSDGLSPFEAYKRPFARTENKPLLSIVFYNIGLSDKVTKDLIENFSSDVTFVFSPYVGNLKNMSDKAREEGHEVWLTLPMETKDFPADDPGPLTLMVNASVEKNTRRLESVLSSTQGYAGFVTQKNHVFKREDATVNPSIENIFKRGLAMMDSNPTLYSFVGDLAANNDYPQVKNDFWLDDDLTPTGLNQKVRQIIDYGQSGKSLVVMLSPYPNSIKTMQKFLNSAAADKFQLAPLSAQVRYGE